MGALGALEEYGGWLVPRLDLDLLEVSLRVPALGTGLIDLVHILPGFLASQDVIDLLPLEVHCVFNLLLDDEYVWAGLAEETEVCESLLYEQ